MAINEYEMEWKMIEISEANIGNKVIYNAGYPGAIDEYGIITSFNDEFVFVRFDLSGGTSQACRRENLRYDL